MIPNEKYFALSSCSWVLTARILQWLANSPSSEIYFRHETKRCLLPGRKAMTNLDSIFKSRDITLPTKICIVKTMVFSVVMYRCELDHKEGLALKIWCLQIVVLEKTHETLGLQGDQTSQFWRKSTLNIHWKDCCWSWSSYTLATWCEDPLEKTPMLGKTEGKRRGRQRLRWLESITDSMDVSLI